MSGHLQREIDNLKKKLLALGAFVEEDVQKAVTAISERNASAAREVIESDPDIDKMEIDIEEDCLKVLALHQPVAIDLRFIVAVLKINNDLERIGDLAVNIAERAAFLATQERVDIPFDFVGMASKAKTMLARSLDALINGDTELAHSVCAADDEVDQINREMYYQIQDGIRNSPEQMVCLLHLLSVSRHLERIADHATNIAEDVIYMIAGEIVRHRVEEFTQKRS
ncbi:MAG TPA: phosphate signaling complex protein PhoU [Candidatus Latescibacteria bacterium]|nr:phosphate signaling complex protein PhoU [Candidatus Latescibacterota bacterium]HQI75000.1 phosphate signaling complex protein PhoU [Candidatus Latescibacterota bacterium]HQK22792.1 phosphate signaling complex protein PhoU [Candidatus Latescibacterota bacterium]